MWRSDGIKRLGAITWQMFDTIEITDLAIDVASTHLDTEVVHVEECPHQLGVQFLLNPGDFLAMVGPCESLLLCRQMQNLDENSLVVMAYLNVEILGSEHGTTSIRDILSNLRERLLRRFALSIPRRRRKITVAQEFAT